MIHANDYDSLTMWCERDGTTCAERSNYRPDFVGGQGSPETAELAEVTCAKCLSSIVAFGEAAKAQLAKVSP